MEALPTLRSEMRLLVADDHCVVAQGIERLLLESFRHVDVVPCGESIIDHVQKNRIDLVIADISMRGISGIEALRRVRQLGLQTPFIFLTMHGDCRVAAEAIRAGAHGYLLKSSAGEELLRAIEEVIGGRTYVTPTLAGPTITASETSSGRALTGKQQRILSLVALGLRSKQIAYELGISVRTVESHKYAIMQQLGVHGTVELVRKSEQIGLLASTAWQRPAA